jgi:hypothetical protein
MTGQDTRSESERFIDEALAAFAFLAEYGFRVHRAEPDPLNGRGEDIVAFESKSLAVVIQREGWGDAVWGFFGRAGDEAMVLNGIGFWEVFERLNVQLPQHSSWKPQTHALADALKTHCGALLGGDLSLIESIWQERLDRYDALTAHQRAIAYRIEQFGDDEILELPNTKAALGEDFLRRFPDHDFSQDRIWLVCNAMGEFYCMDYDAAREWCGLDREDGGER